MSCAGNMGGFELGTRIAARVFHHLRRIDHAQVEGTQLTSKPFG